MWSPHESLSPPLDCDRTRPRLGVGQRRENQTKCRDKKTFRSSVHQRPRIDLNRALTSRLIGPSRTGGCHAGFAFLLHRYHYRPRQRQAMLKRIGALLCPKHQGAGKVCLSAYPASEFRCRVICEKACRFGDKGKILRAMRLEFGMNGASSWGNCAHD